MLTVLKRRYASAIELLERTDAALHDEYSALHELCGMYEELEDCEVEIAPGRCRRPTSREIDSDLRLVPLKAALGEARNEFQRLCQEARGNAFAQIVLIVHHRADVSSRWLSEMHAATGWALCAMSVVGCIKSSLHRLHRLAPAS